MFKKLIRDLKGAMASEKKFLRLPTMAQETDDIAISREFYHTGMQWRFYHALQHVDSLWVVNSRLCRLKEQDIVYKRREGEFKNLCDALSYIAVRDIDAEKNDSLVFLKQTIPTYRDFAQKNGILFDRDGKAAIPDTTQPPRNVLWTKKDLSVFKQSAPAPAQGLEIKSWEDIHKYLSQDADFGVKTMHKEFITSAIKQRIDEHTKFEKTLDVKILDRWIADKSSFVHPEYERFMAASLAQRAVGYSTVIFLLRTGAKLYAEALGDIVMDAQKLETVKTIGDSAVKILSDVLGHFSEETRQNIKNIITAGSDTTGHPLPIETIYNRITLPQPSGIRGTASPKGG